jgi:hypothetical protein
MKHGKWRIDKEPEEGFTRELYNPRVEKYLGNTNLDEIKIFQHPELVTMYHILERTLQRIPNNDWIGERVSDRVEDGWKYSTFREISDAAKMYSLGVVQMDLCPPVQVEGREHRFMVMLS